MTSFVGLVEVRLFVRLSYHFVTRLSISVSCICVHTCQVNRTVASFCTQLIWARCSVSGEDNSMAASKTNEEEDEERLCSLPRDYPPGEP